MNSTYSSEEKDCQSAKDAGPDWPKKTSDRDNMDKFCVNTARSFLGRNVNLHLKDGSVIINVHIAGIRRDDFNRHNFLTCVPYGSRNGGKFKVPLKNIAWAELLNLNLLLTSG